MLPTPQILLIDDDRAWLETLTEYLQNKGFVIAAFNDPLQGLAWGEQSGVPLAVIDFQMPGMTGLELLEHLEDLPQVVFTTAYDEYAIKAFEVNALDYLLKPIVPARLAAALARVRPRSDRGRLEQVFVRDGERCWIVRIPDIFLLESEGNYTRVYFGAERPLIRRSLNALQEQLDPAVFFRAGRKEIINLKWIDKVDITVAGGLLITLRGGRTVEMSRRQSVRLKEILSL